MMKNLLSFLCLFLTCCISAFAQVNLQSGLVAYYTFNNTLADSTANHLDLTATGGPFSSTDRFANPDGAYRFNAISDDYASTGFSSLLAPEELTLCAWVNLTDPSVDQKVAGKTPVGPGYLMGVDSSKIDCEIWDVNNTHFRLKRGNVLADTWTHLAISYKANAFLKVYINGLPVDSIASSGFGVGAANATPFTIASAPWDPVALNMDGLVDDLCLYDRQLSNAEVFALFNFVPTGLNSRQFHYGNVGLFPNPAQNGMVTLNFSEAQNGPVTVCIFDAFGKEVSTQTISNSPTKTIDLSTYPQGMYTLRIRTNDGKTCTKKLVVSRR